MSLRHSFLGKDLFKKPALLHDTTDGIVRDIEQTPTHAWKMELITLTLTRDQHDTLLLPHHTAPA